MPSPDDMAESPVACRYRFGVFELDAGTGELRRNGLRVRLHTQPLQLLLLLLERPGAMLTREEICHRLWPDGTFVDYEHGVNSAVNRLREALGDRASNPRFVETLARRGYRFVAPVERVAVSVGEVSVPAQSRQNAGQSKGQADEGRAPESDAEEIGLFESALAAQQDLPRISHPVVQILFVLMQLMYLGFYVGALANLDEIGELMAFLPMAGELSILLVVTATLLIPVRIFLLCAVLFHAPRFRAKFRRLWWFVVPLDLLWALAPFLLLHHINYGLALACTTVLVYAPFAQRSLVLMGAGSRDDIG